jgi:CheY-like chemotaxis protein/GAF domain-containing protein
MSQERILIVEDDSSVREILSDTLRHYTDYELIMAADGKEGLRRALEDPPSVMLLDLALPEIGGLEIMEALNAENRSIPTIIITADNRGDTILRAFRLGAKDFLRKPFHIHEIRSALENALTEERLRRERDKLTRALTLANQHQQRQLDNWVALDYIARTIISTLNESEVLRRVVATANHLLQVEAAALLLLDEESGALRYAVTMGEQPSDDADSPDLVATGLAFWVLQNGESLHVRDVWRDPRFDPTVDQVPGVRSQAVLCVPLKSRREVLGVFEVINKQGSPQSPAFEQEDVMLLKTLASWITIAVENARLNRTMQEHAAMKTLRQAVITLAHYINNHLMAFALELDSLEQSGLPDRKKVEAVLDLSRRSNETIASVVKALDKLKDVRTTSYIGSEDMIDIEELLVTASEDQVG